MKRFAVIDQHGIIRRTGTCLDDDLGIQAGEGESAYEAESQVEEATHYFDGQGFALFPMAKPSEFHRFDRALLLWVDDRNQAELAAALQGAKLNAVQRVNAGCAAARTQFMTDIPGQEMIYLTKEAEALRYLSDPQPDLTAYPLLTAETGITAPTADQLAQIWANMGALWRSAAAISERVRMTALIAIEAAQSEAELAQILEGFGL